VGRRIAPNIILLVQRRACSLLSVLRANPWHKVQRATDIPRPKKTKLICFLLPLKRIKRGRAKLKAVPTKTTVLKPVIGTSKTLHEINV
jgi:hypothetical protein